MALNLKKFASVFSLFFLGAFGLHFLFLRATHNLLGIQYNFLIEFYAFLLVLTFVHFIALRWLFKKWPKYSGLMFTALSLFKMVIAIIYLLPYIFPAAQDAIAKALNFMVVYLLFLTFEVVFVAKCMAKVNFVKNANKNH